MSGGFPSQRPSYDIIFFLVIMSARGLTKRIRWYYQNILLYWPNLWPAKCYVNSRWGTVYCVWLNIYTLYVIVRFRYRTPYIFPGEIDVNEMYPHLRFVAVIIHGSLFENVFGILHKQFRISTKICIYKVVSVIYEGECQALWQIAPFGFRSCTLLVYTAGHPGPVSDRNRRLLFITQNC